MSLEELLQETDVAYIVISPTARTSPDFPLRGYAGPSGRLDVIARAVAVVFSLPEFERELFLAVLLGPPRPPKTLIIRRSCLDFRPTEKAVMNLFRALLDRKAYKGCMALDLDVKDLLFIIKKRFRLIYLSEKGDDLEHNISVITGPKVAFILGAHVDIPEKFEILVKNLAYRIVSIETKSLLTSHVLLFISYLRFLKVRGLTCSEQP